MKPLEDYAFRDEQGKDQGVNGSIYASALFLSSHEIFTHFSIIFSFYCVKSSLISFYIVRQKSKEIISFLQDDERLREARKNARKTRDKFVGISSNDINSQYSELVRLDTILTSMDAVHTVNYTYLVVQPHLWNGGTHYTLCTLITIT